MIRYTSTVIEIRQRAIPIFPPLGALGPMQAATIVSIN